jgi:hypothetical protein
VQVSPPDSKSRATALLLHAVLPAVIAKVGILASDFGLDAEQPPNKIKDEDWGRVIDMECTIKGRESR